MDYFEESLKLHSALRGKITVQSKIDVRTKDDLSLVYSPGVAQPCREIYAHPEKVWDLTMKGNTVAIVTDGSAVLGLGNIGAEASIPVMEGKAMLFRKFAGINAFPICISSQDTNEIISVVRNIAPIFGGINLEDISAPRSFEIEAALQDLGIPVFHDDQHGTAIVVLAALMNAAKLVNKPLSSLSIVINGSGAAGMAIARLLRCNFGEDEESPSICIVVGEVVVCDRHGIVQKDRTDLNSAKRDALNYTNPHNKKGTVRDALVGADVFIGVSVGDLLRAEDIQTMAKDAIVFALANPTPEIMPEEAKKGGAAIVGTGRSDLPNQVNNVLGFPGIFRGALNARARKITPGMKLAAAKAIAECISKPEFDAVIPSSLNGSVAHKVAEAVEKIAVEEMKLNLH